MKIVAIDEKNSSTHWTAFSVDTPITREVADQFRELYSQCPDSGGIKVKVQYSLVLIQTTKLPDNFTGFISQVLTQAETIVAKKKEAPLQMEQSADDQKIDAQKYCDDLKSPDGVKVLQC